MLFWVAPCRHAIYHHGMETCHPTPAPPDISCEFCDAPAVVTIGSLTGREDVPVCESDIHLDQAIWGGAR